ncbi:MAG: YfbM family protein [Planctomycetes bacterium]|nr:YfbM family protein [Planctomycetota bacterium]
MGMYMHVVTIRDANIARVLQDPPLIWRVLEPADTELYEEARRASRKRGCFSWLFAGGSRSDQSGPAADLALLDDEGIDTDLDKAWNGIHYLLTGTSSEGVPPLNFLLAGGTPVAKVEVGYGPPRVFRAQETKALLEVLSEFTESELGRRFHPQDMLAKGVYPEVWDRGEEELEYLLDYFLALRGALDHAVRRGLGVVLYIS